MALFARKMAEISRAGEPWRWNVTLDFTLDVRAYCVGLDKSHCVECAVEKRAMKCCRWRRRERECSEEKKCCWSTRWSNTHHADPSHSLMIKYDRQFDCIFSCVINSYKHMLQLFSSSNSIQCWRGAVENYKSVFLSSIITFFSSWFVKFQKEKKRLDEACSRNCWK